jgi:hypothetical protein
MSENPRYEEVDQQFNDLPMPDQEESWQKMKEMLDKDDNDDRIVPPIFLNSCLGWGLLLLVGLTVVWLVVRPERWWSETTKAKDTSLSDKVQKPGSKEASGDEKSTISKHPINKDETSIITDQKQKISPSTQSSVIEQNKKSEPKTKDTLLSDKVQKQNTKEELRDEKSAISKHPINKDETSVITGQKQKISRSVQSPVIDQNKNKSSFNTVPVRNKKPEPKTKEPIQKTDLAQQTLIKSNNIPTKVNDDETFDQRNKMKNGDTSLFATNQQQIPSVKDSVKTESMIQPVDSAIQKKTILSQRKLMVTAGLGLQQLIPIAGQAAVPYNYYGSEGVLPDYTPSVFLQLHKKGKWFIMGEFRYGAAQSVKEFSYNQQTKYDTASMNVTMTTMRLKKTYYHQLPLSFNYYVIPNLSVGIGGMYSRFYGATTEKEINTQNVLTQTNATVEEIIPVKHFTDSFLYKTQVHTFIQADYHWKRFSFGLRYTRDLQPYIRYTKPDGTIDEKKNQSLQLMIRYRLWQPEKL